MGKYLQPFSAKVATATQNREIFCVDGFAGAARYEDGSEGSPLLIANFSEECLGWRDPVFLKMINVEPDAKGDGIFPLLEKATEKWVAKGIVKNINTDFYSALPEILVRIGSAPALFFIDPFGPTYLHFSHLLPVLYRDQRITKLIINFDTDGLRRIVDAALSTNINLKAAETNAQNVSKILGKENWKDKIVGKNLSSEQCEEVLLHEYKNNIARYGYNVVAYPIREALDKKPKYHFVYCTRHHSGITLMNDFMREEEDLLYGEYIETDSPLFRSLNLANKEIFSRREELSAIMRNYLQIQPGVTRNQVIKNLVSIYFGRFHTKDFRAVFKDFIDSGQLTTIDHKTKIDDRLYNYHARQ